MSFRKRIFAVLMAAAFFFTSVPAGAAVAGLQAHGAAVSGPARVSPRDGTHLLARHKKWKKRLRRARRRVKKQVRRVEKKVVRPVVRKATPKPLRPLRKKISREIKRGRKRVVKQAGRTGKQIKKQAGRTGRQIKKQTKRTGRQIAKETRRTTKRVGKEIKRTGRRVDREVRRFRTRLQQNQALGILVKVAVVTLLGPQALVLLNAIDTVQKLAQSEGKGADFLRAGMGLLGPTSGNVAGQTLLRLGQDIEKLRTKRGREEFLKSALASKTGIDVGAVERLGTREGRRELLGTLANPAERSEAAAIFGILDRVESMNLRPGRNPDAVIRSLASVVGAPRAIDAVMGARARAQANAARDFGVADRALQTSTAPNVMGLQASRALSMLQNVGLRHRVTSYLPTGNPALGNRVARQIPGPNAPVTDNTVVSLTIYRPPVRVAPVRVRPVAPRTRRRAAARPRRRSTPVRRYAPVIKPIITGVTPLPAAPGSIITILGRNFNPNARLNRIRVPVATGRRAKFRKSGVRSRRGNFGYRFVRAVSGDAQGTRLRVRLPRNLRSGRGTYLLVHNGRAYSQYFRLQIGGPPRRARVARGRGVVPNLRNQPIGSALALLQKAGYRPGAIGFTNTKDCRFSRRVASQIPGAGRRLQRGGRVSLQAYWCVR